MLWQRNAFRTGIEVERVLLGNTDLAKLLRTTLQQAGVVRDALASQARDALERGAREGRSRLDDLRSNRRRTDALAELGELVLDLIRRGEIDLEELPEARELVDHLDELDAEVDDDRTLRRLGRDRDRDDAGHGARDFENDARYERRNTKATVDERPARADIARPPSRKRFDDRDDGTVSSSKWQDTGRAKSNSGRVWRPVDDRPTEPPPHRSGPVANPARRGGISFEDEDLADYMHPEDVPPKEPPKDE